jgi:hypothetical protein
VNAAFATYAAKSVTVPAGTIARADEDEAAPTPSCFDARTWERARQRWPAGLVQVDPKAVVARATVDPYLVLPDKAGRPSSSAPARWNTSTASNSAS